MGELIYTFYKSVELVVFLALVVLSIIGPFTKE